MNGKESQKAHHTHHQQPSHAAKIRFLIDLQDGQSGVILCNQDRKSSEMGLFPGARVHMFRNRRNERSVVIGAEEARFLVSRAIAQQISLEDSCNL